MKVNSLIKQFVKYCFVGGISFIIDFSILTFSYQLFFIDYRNGVFFSAALGFMSGLCVNYFLSKKAVFNSNDSRFKNKILEFSIYFAIGIAGLIITELGMFIGTSVLSVHYAYTKIVVATAVLIWNFIARRFLAYK